MRRWWAGVWGTILGLALLAVVEPAFAQKVDVPPPLQPWKAWVLEGESAKTCPRIVPSGETICGWPSSLSLSVGDRGGDFSVEVSLDARGWVHLPGGPKRWPLDVRANDHEIAVVDHEGPSVLLDPGRVRLRGVFRWDTLPEAISVPREIGIVSLTVSGKKVDFPNRDEAGSVWFQKVSSQVEGDRLEMTVHRKVTDDLPLLLETRLSLNIAGKNREVLLGKVFGPGFIPLKLESTLPARLESDGHLRVQVRPGSWTITLVAQSEGPVLALSRPNPEGVWRDGDEVWCFEPRNDLRIVSTEGVPRIDVEQTSLPAEWRKFEAFAVRLGAKMVFTQRQRGDANPAPDRLTLARALWLDFDGHGATFRDTLTGQMNRSWRLDVARTIGLGRVAMSGKDVFITKGAAGLSGVEVRQGTLNVQADGRIPDLSAAVPAVGWNHDFESVSTTVHIPPGWDLFHASGVDRVSDSWIRRWTLFEIFLVLVTSVAFYRLFGRTWGILAVAALVLTTTREDSPSWFWLVLLAFEAISRFVKQGRPAGVLRVLRVLALVILGVVLIPFSIQEVRYGLHPALERPGSAASSDFGAVAGLLGKSARMADEPTSPVPEEQTLEENDRVETEKKQESRKDDKAKGGKARMKVSDLNLPSSIPAQNVAQQRQFNTSEYDPNAMVQTGPGVPAWSWKTVSLTFNGRVPKDQSLQLYLLSPP